MTLLVGCGASDAEEDSVVEPPEETAEAVPEESAGSDAEETDFQGEERTLTGSSPSGAEWEARVPADWNGTAILYGHGFRGPGENPAWDDGNADVLDTLAERGYAVIASSYSTTLWALETAPEDQLDALNQFIEQDTEPARVIAYGLSMGGLVTGLLAEDGDAGIDGAVPVCGLMHGGVGLNNYQLDAAFAAAVLLVEDQDLTLTGFMSPDESAPTVETLEAALTQAQESPEGRARLALVGSLLNVPQYIEGVDPEDLDALTEAQAPLIAQTLAEVIDRRSGIVSFAGGDSGWTEGVDYAEMVRDSSHLEIVEARYSEAGLDLDEDLERINAEADLAPDEEALKWMLETSQPTGDIQVPVFSIHTLNDLLAPVEAQAAYQEAVDEAGQADLLEQSYIEREGHCQFTVSETLVSLDVLEDRLDTGEWPELDAQTLNEQAADLDLDESDFVEFTPPEFINTREW